MSQTLASLLLFALVGWIFISVRRVARESAAARWRILLVSGAAIASGLLAAFVVPRWVPETPGSPGTLVVIALLWVLAAAIMVVALPAFLAAFTARPRSAEGLE